MKRVFFDALTAVVIYAIIIFSIVILTTAAFWENAVSWNNEDKSLSLFGKTITHDSRVALAIDALLKTNNTFFGSSFSDFSKNTAVFLCNLAKDVFCLSYQFAKDVMNI